MTVNAGDYYKFRTTTQQLDEHLNHIVESGDRFVSAHFTGGRDWILICRKTPPPTIADLAPAALQQLVGQVLSGPPIVTLGSPETGSR